MTHFHLCKKTRTSAARVCWILQYICSLAHRHTVTHTSHEQTHTQTGSILSADTPFSLLGPESWNLGASVSRLPWFKHVAPSSKAHFFPDNCLSTNNLRSKRILLSILLWQHWSFSLTLSHLTSFRNNTSFSSGLLKHCVSSLETI